MNNRIKPNTLAIACLFSGGLLLASSPAWSDVVGRLHFSVKDADTEKPVIGAKIVLHDNGNVHPDTLLPAASDGTALSDNLENRPWSATISAPGYKDTTVTQTVVADTTTEVAVDLEKPEKVIFIHQNVNATHSQSPTVATKRSHEDVVKYPSTGNNPQSLTSFLLTNPGFVESSNGVDHPRGEHASTTINIGGIEIPGALQGRNDQLFSPNVLESADAQTGAYAPEYGSECAAIINGSLRSGPVIPFVNFTEQAGSFSTFDSGLTMGGQTGDPLENVESGPVPKRFRYFIDLNSRTTLNSQESPQPNFQTAHNAGSSSTLFGNFDYVVDPKNTVNFFLDTSPASTEIANRAGLSGIYAPYGQGYGYGGFRNADGTVDTTNVANPGGLGDTTILTPSQQADGQDITQTDSNSFGFINLRHSFNPATTGLFSVGLTHSGIGIHSNNLAPADQSLLPVDSSIEFVPNVSRKFDQGQLQGSVSHSVSNHTYKAGFVADKQSGDESDQFSPGSQLALDALAAIDVDGSGNFAGRLTPVGHFTGATDVYGNPVYTANAGAVAPTISIHKSGYYGAAYVQDTWRATRKLVANYGLRLDTYSQKYELSTGDGTSVNETELSPRLNFSYALVPTTILRLSYNHLFTQPPLAEGAVLGNIAIKPETINQYDTSIERQFAPGQIVKLAGYYKQIRNQDDTGILIPFTQIGAYTTLNYQYASVHGVELSYDLIPHENVGWGSYLAYSRSYAAPGGLDQSGGPAPTVNDHDQTDTYSVGGSYTWKSQALVGLTGYYGSGEASSDLGDGKRHPHKQVNLRIAGSPKMLGVGTLELDVSNLFDEQDVLNFNSGFSGTRFQQARFVLLSIKGNF